MGIFFIRSYVAVLFLLQKEISFLGGVLSSQIEE